MCTMPKALKTVLVILVALAVLAGAAFAVYWFALRPTPLKGSVENSHKISVSIGRDMFYDILVPNEATLLETDEHTIYRYDLLTIGVQGAEPMTDYKVKVEDRWVFVESDEDWLVPTIYSFENFKAYEVFPEYEYLEDEDGNPVNWADGPAPTYHANASPVIEGTHVHKDGGYVMMEEIYSKWDELVENMLAKLCKLSGEYVPHYYNDGNIFYAEVGGYAVGAKYINYNTQLGLVACGDDAIAEVNNQLLKE